MAIRTCSIFPALIPSTIPSSHPHHLKKAMEKHQSNLKKITKSIMMKNSSSKSKSQHKKSQENKQLFQRFENIEREWDIYKQAVKPQSPKHFSTGRSCLSAYSSIVTSLHDQILENSPRSLMSSLQESSRRKASPMVWKVRNNDIAVEETLRERRAALASGKLKGRRLFPGSSSEEEEEGEGQDGVDLICNECFDYLCHQEMSEVRSLGSSYGSDDEKRCFLEEYDDKNQRDSFLDSSLSSEEKFKDNSSLVEGEKTEKDDDHVQFGANLRGKNGGRRWMLGVVTMAALGIVIISFNCNGGYFNEKEVFLIPT